LILADQKNAYTLTDLGTYLFMREKIRLRDLYNRDDPLMLNQYSYMAVNPERFPWVNFEAAKKLRDYLVRPDVQEKIANHLKDRFGQSLFEPLYGRCVIPVP